MDEMRERLAALDISAEEFYGSLTKSAGSADRFAGALYEAAGKGASFADVEKAIGINLDELGGIMKSVTFPAGDSLYSAMENAGYPLDEMRRKMEELGVSGETFHNALETSGGDAKAFADALYNASRAGTSFADVERAIGFDLDTLSRIMAGAMGDMDSALNSVSAPDLTVPVSFDVQRADFSQNAADAQRAAEKLARET